MGGIRFPAALLAASFLSLAIPCYAEALPGTPPPAEAEARELRSRFWALAEEPGAKEEPEPQAAADDPRILAGVWCPMRKEKAEPVAEGEKKDPELRCDVGAAIVLWRFKRFERAAVVLPIGTGTVGLGIGLGAGGDGPPLGVAIGPCFPWDQDGIYWGGWGGCVGVNANVLMRLRR